MHEPALCKCASTKLSRNTIYTWRKLHKTSFVLLVIHLRLRRRCDLFVLQMWGANWILSSMALTRIAPLCLRLTVHSLQIHLQTLSECWAFTAFQCSHVPSYVRYGWGASLGLFSLPPSTRQSVVTAKWQMSSPSAKDEFQSTTPVPPRQMKGLIAGYCVFEMPNSSIRKPIYMN